VLTGGAKNVSEGAWLLDVLDDSIDELVEVAVKTAEEAENVEELRKEDEEASTMLWTDV
jgi:hypothetical protein